MALPGGLANEWAQDNKNLCEGQNTMKKILVVDDEPDMCAALRRELAQEGYEVASVFNGADALVRISEEPFDLLVVDMMMPCMSGLQVIKVLRKWVPELPIIGLTGFLGKGLIVDAAQYRVICLTKPVDLRVLVEEIEQALNHRHTHP